jgi:hypothetical protein
VLRIVDTWHLAASWAHIDESSDELDLTSKLDELEARRNQAADSFAAGRVPLAAFERAIATIEREAEETRRRLAAATKRAPFAYMPTGKASCVRSGPILALTNVEPCLAR